MSYIVSSSSPFIGYAATVADVANTASETDSVSCTVGANEMADGDVLVVDVAYLLKNNKGTAGTVVWKAYFGSAVATITTGALGLSNAATEWKYWLRFYIRRVGNDCWVRDSKGLVDSGGGAAAIVSLDPETATYGDPAGLATTVGNVAVIAAPTFSSGQIVKITVTLSAAHASFYVKAQSARIVRQAAT